MAFVLANHTSKLASWNASCREQVVYKESFFAALLIVSIRMAGVSLFSALLYQRKVPFTTIFNNFQQEITAKAPLL